MKRKITEQTKTDKEEQRKLQERTLPADVSCESSDYNDDESNKKDSDEEFKHNALNTPPTVKSPQSKHVVTVTPKLATALDRTNISDRKAMFDDSYDDICT